MNSPTDSRCFGTADFVMIVTCFLWALGTVVCKNAFGNTPDSFRVMIFNGLRFPAATLLLFLSIKLSGVPAGINREHLPRIAIISFFGSFLFIVTFHVGLSITTASNTGIIMAIIPLVIVLMSFIARVEKPGKWLLIGICMGCAGVTGMNCKEGGLSLNTGDILVLLSCFCWGFYAVYGEKIMETYPPLVTTAWIFFFTSLYHIPLVIYFFPSQSWSTISGWNWFNLSFAAVGPLFIANWLYFSAIHRIGPSRSGIYINLEPVFTVILAFIMRNEHISLSQIAGLVVIILGVVIAKIPGKGIIPPEQM